MCANNLSDVDLSELAELPEGKGKVLPVHRRNLLKSPFHSIVAIAACPHRHI